MLKFILVSLLSVSGLFAVSGCGHHRHQRYYAKMSVEDHERMAKAHQDTAACLKEGKPAEDCKQIMKSAMKEECAKGACDMKKKKDCCGK